MFWTKLDQKGYFQSRTDAVNTTIEFCIFQLVQKLKFTLNEQIVRFGPNMLKKGF